MAGPVIKINAFTGERPRIDPILLPESAAQSALDVRLDDGALTPVREDMFEASVTSAIAKTIYRYLGSWLSWDQLVHLAPGPVAEDRLYYTGDGVPKMRVAGTVYNLALTRPTAALTATLSGTGSGDIITRTYVYTWVTDFGEESEPCTASAAIKWKPGQTVTLSGFQSAPSGRNITKQRIYRSQTGQTGTYFYLIAERPAASADFVDNVAANQFQEQLPSASWNPPPNGLVGLTALPNGFMAGYVGKQLYFSEPYRPHAWPEKYVLTTNDTIMGLAALGGTLIVLTQGVPYILQGSHPASMTMVKTEANFPCINSRSIVDMGYAVIYASLDGFASISASGQVQLISGDMFNRDAWLALDPSSFIASQTYGRYISFYTSADVDGNEVSGYLMLVVSGNGVDLLRGSSAASAAWYDFSNGALYFIKKGTKSIMRMDAPSGVRKKLYWKSKQYLLPYEENFGAIRVDSDAQTSGTDSSAIEDYIAQTIAANLQLLSDGLVGGAFNDTIPNTYSINGDSLTFIPIAYQNGDYTSAVGGGQTTVGVYADGVKVAAIGKTGKAVRLPSGFLARMWEIEVLGDLKIKQIALAKSIDDLRTA